MSISSKVFEALDNKDIEAIRAICNEGFVFVDDYKRLTIDDWMELLTNLYTKAEDKDFSRDRYVVVNRRYILALVAIRTVNEKNIRILFFDYLKTANFGGVKFIGYHLEL